MVGGDPEVPARLEPGREKLQKHPVQEPPLSLPLLGPRVGKVDVERADGRGRDTTRDEQAAVGANDSRVRHRRARQATAREAVVRERTLDSQKVVRGLSPRRFDQESRFAGAELDLERSTTPEEILGDESPTRPQLLVGRDGEAEVPPVGQVAVLKRSDTARANSDVVALPPRSPVRTPSAKVASRAASIRSA